jgi:hypothetical protein
MYWQLTTRSDDPRRLTVPDGLDPAGFLHRDSTAALRTAIEAAGNLTEHLLDAHLAAGAHDYSPDVIGETVRAAATMIAASPPARWLDHIERVTEALGLPPGIGHMAVLDARPAIGRAPTMGSPMRSQQGSPATPRPEPHSRPAPKPAPPERPALGAPTPARRTAVPR